MTAKKKQKPNRRNNVDEAGKPRGPATKMLARILIWTTATISVIALLYGSYTGLKWVLFTHNSHFTLNALDVKATENLRSEGVVQILAGIGIQPGTANLFEIDILAARQRLEQEVVVARAEVSRRIPDTLVVRIYERRPSAKLQCKPRLLIDDEGYILPYWETRGDILLPTITGIHKPSQLSPGQVTTDKALLGAVRFLHETRSRPEGVIYDIELIQLDYYLPSLKVHLRKRDIFLDGAVVIVPVDGMDAALDRLRDIVKMRMEAGKVTRFIDVTYEKNCPVKS